MKKISTLFLFSILHHFSFCQNQEILLIKGDTSAIVLERINIDVEIVGHMATTVTEMTFYNPNDRVLEGELNFPLNEGQSVFRFAMDVNGKLREGVAVEKNQGRKAFEGVVRQAIDPGLLEMTVGNNYKARVYPIPANGRKTILVGYEEELKNEVSPLYQLILDYGRVDELNLKVVVLNQEDKPLIKENELSNISFDRWESSYSAELQEENFEASGLLSFEVPAKIEESVYRQNTNLEDYFYVTFMPEVSEHPRRLPLSLAIIWDTSKSGEKRDLELELDFLRKYLTKFINLKIKVILFSNEINDQTEFQISNGNSDELIEYLRIVDYDGGTNFKSLNLSQLNFDEYLVFSDGISNLSSAQLRVNGKILNSISSSSISDHDFLRHTAEITGGHYINLLNTTSDDAVETLLNLNYQFISAFYNQRKIKEVYPSLPYSVKKNAPFSLAGIVNTRKPVSLNVNFGIGGEILQTKKITINQPVESESIPRFWANKKIAELVRQKELNKDKIVELGKSYGLVTPYTSLIVLDRVEDYLQYDIEPPSELKEEYSRLVEQQANDLEVEKEDIIELALENYEDRLNWWQKDLHDSSIFVPKKKVEPRAGQPDRTGENDSSDETSLIEENNETSNGQEESLDIDSPLTLPEQNVDTTVYNKEIEGIILDESGEAIIGATIQIKGTTMGTVSNLDGRFIVRSRAGDVLVTNFIGYNSTETQVDDQSSIRITLAEDVAQLSEVVVTALGIETHRQSLSSSVTTVTNQLQGRVPGVRIVGATGTVVVRGNSSVTVGSKPLYVIDGVVSENTNLDALNPDEIASMNIIRDEHATSLYGARAADGVIVIMTKSGLEDELVMPDSITSMFDQDLIVIEWKPNEPYLDSLKNSSEQGRYKKYLELRDQYGKAPSFYLIVGDYFISSNQQDIGLRVMSNITELDLENHETLKILAHKYRQVGAYETSIFLFEKILELRNDEPQSKRDLALAYQASGEYQKALDLLLEILIQPIDDVEDRFPLFKSTIISEINCLIATHKNELDLAYVPKELVIDMPVDIRVVLEWNALETDLDLWVTEPNSEKCYYKNELTKLGGRLTKDYVDGYGPEEYMLKTAAPGQYKIEVKYFDERVQKISGPVTLQVSIFTNYASKNQKVKEFTLQLEGEEDVIEVGTFNWE